MNYGFMITKQGLSLDELIELLDYSYLKPIKAGDEIELKRRMIKITQEFYKSLKQALSEEINTNYTILKKTKVRELEDYKEKGVISQKFYEALKQAHDRKYLKIGRTNYVKSFNKVKENKVLFNEDKGGISIHSPWEVIDEDKKMNEILKKLPPLSYTEIISEDAVIRDGYVYSNNEGKKIVKTKQPLIIDEAINALNELSSLYGKNKSITELLTKEELIDKLTWNNLNSGSEINGYKITTNNLEDWKKELRAYKISFKRKDNIMSVHRVRGGGSTLPQKIENFYYNLRL